MQTIVEIPLTRPNPRRLTLGVYVEVTRIDAGADLIVRGIISRVTVTKRHQYHSNEDPYQTWISIEPQDGSAEQEFELDNIVITYASDHMPKTDSPPSDCGIYMG